MTDKLTIKDIYKAVALLKENQKQPDKDGFLEYEPLRDNWNFTPCLTRYNKVNGVIYDIAVSDYSFYIVDYDLPENWVDYDHIIDMRNKGVVKTKYFRKRKDALKFLSQYIKGDNDNA